MITSSGKFGILEVPFDWRQPGGEQVQVPSETKLDFKFQQPVAIALAPADKLPPEAS